MEAQSETKIKFFLEPIQKVNFDDLKNPSRKKNLRYHKLQLWLVTKTIALTMSLPLIIVASCLYPKIVTISIPTLLILVTYILKLKIMFQRVSKRIIEPPPLLTKGDFVALELKGHLQIFVLLKRSMSIYYLKKIELRDMFLENAFEELEHYKYNDLKIVKAAALYRNFMKIIPVSSALRASQSFKNVS